MAIRERLMATNSSGIIQQVRCDEDGILITEDRGEDNMVNFFMAWTEF